VNKSAQRARHRVGDIVVIEVSTPAQCEHCQDALKKLGALLMWHT
jgi:hypothetical protein